MNMPHTPARLSAILLLAIGACHTAPTTAAARAELESRAATALARAKQTDPTIAEHLRAAAGYAVFPRVGKGAAGAGGAYGRGVLYEGDAVVGYCDLTQATIGVQLGGQTYTEILSFQTQESLAEFKAGDFQFGAQATAVALRSGAAVNASYSRGVTVFTMDEAGLMFEAALGGQEFDYQAK